MSDPSRTHHATFRSDAPQPTAAEPQPGQFCWTVIRPGGTMLTCELRDYGQWGVEVQVTRDAMSLFRRRHIDRDRAVAEADELRRQYLCGGGTLSTG